MVVLGVALFALGAILLGNMWGQSWDYLYPELEPYKGVAPIDVTPVLAKSYDPKKMVQMGEAFYTSLGMDPLPSTFWEKSRVQIRDLIWGISSPAFQA